MKQMLNFALLLFFLLVFSSASFAQSNDTPAHLKNSTDYKEYLNKIMDYPLIAIQKGITGRVEVEFIVNAEGCVDSILIRSTPHKSLSRAVEKAIKKTACNWIPKQVEGKPQNQKLQTYFDFTLSSR